MSSSYRCKGEDSCHGDEEEEETGKEEEGKDDRYVRQ